MAKRLLDDNLTAQLSQLVDRITEDVELIASLDDRSQSDDLWQLLEDIAALSDKITTRRDDDAHERRPSFTIARKGTDIAVSFAGIPMGHEFSSLVLALLQVGGNPIKEDEELIEAVKNLDGEYEFVTYMSLTCQNCPTVVQSLNTMSVLNPKIRHTAVEGSLFQDEVTEKNIMSVPTIYLNGELFDSGRMTIDQFVARLDTGASAREAQKLNEKDTYDALVVGQGPAGVSAAIYLARKGLSTGLVGERFGGQVLDTMSIENITAIPHTEGPSFAAAMEQHVGEYDIDVIKNQTATGLSRGEDGIFTVNFGDAARLTAKTVVVATGARWRQMGVPGEDEYRNKGVTYCPHCDGPLFKGKKVAVIGGGNSGIEAAIDLAGLASHVTVLEFADACRADDVLMDKLNSMDNTTVIVNAATSEVIGDGKQVTGLRYTDRTTGDQHELDINGVFVQIGLLPNTEWVDGTLELNERRDIVTDANGQTSLEGVFAAGDSADTAYKQIIVAEGSGATAGLSAWNYLIRT